MGKGFDDLIEHLVDAVALRLAEGATIKDFRNDIYKFYADPSKGNNDGIKIDQKLSEKVWLWLLRREDIFVGRPSEKEDQPEILVNWDEDGSKFKLAAAESTDLLEKSAATHIRIWSSHERCWQAIAGHGVDYKRVPGEEWRLLCLIAAAGPKGIQQPDLVRLSKQDKKSVPGRTDNLQKNGYISKSKILTAGHNTSLLVLKSFLPPAELQALNRPIFQNRRLLFDNLLEYLKERLKNDAAIEMEELQKELGCAPKSWERKSLWRVLERLDIVGVVQRFRVAVPAPLEKRANRVLKKKYVKLLHQPTKEDEKRYLSLTSKDRVAFRRRLEAQDAEAKKEHEEFGDDDDDHPMRPPTQDADDGDITMTEDAPKKRTAALGWDPDRPWTSDVYDAINAAGRPGLTAAATRVATYGRFYERPIDQMLARVSDAWTKAQPDHLAHFHIIRDTDNHGRVTNYVYRSAKYFQQAVDAHHTLWENANQGKPYTPPKPDLDEFGFAKPDKKHFALQGNANHADAIKSLGVPLERPLRADPVLFEHDDGTTDIKWEPSIKGRPKQTRVKLAAVSFSDEDEAEIGTKVTSRDRRTEAEEKAYFEAREQQQDEPIALTNGKQMQPMWKPGSGRNKLIIMDDITPPEKGFEEKELEQPKKRRPVIVMESRVRELVELLKSRENRPEAVDGDAAPTPADDVLDALDAKKEANRRRPRKAPNPTDPLTGKPKVGRPKAKKSEDVVMRDGPGLEGEVAAIEGPTAENAVQAPSATENASTSTPATETPAAEKPKAKRKYTRRKPSAPAGAGETSVMPAPGDQAPAAQTSAVEGSGAQSTAVETPSTETPTAEKPKPKRKYTKRKISAPVAAGDASTVPASSDQIPSGQTPAVEGSAGQNEVVGTAVTGAPATETPKPKRKYTKRKVSALAAAGEATALAANDQVHAIQTPAIEGSAAQNEALGATAFETPVVEQPKPKRKYTRKKALAPAPAGEVPRVAPTPEQATTAEAATASIAQYGPIETPAAETTVIQAKRRKSSAKQTGIAKESTARKTSGQKTTPKKSASRRGSRGQAVAETSSLETPSVDTSADTSAVTADQQGGVDVPNTQSAAQTPSRKASAQTTPVRKPSAKETGIAKKTPARKSSTEKRTPSRRGSTTKLSDVQRPKNAVGTPKRARSASKQLAARPSTGPSATPMRESVAAKEVTPVVDGVNNDAMEVEEVVATSTEPAAKSPVDGPAEEQATTPARLSEGAIAATPAKVPTPTHEVDNSDAMDIDQESRTPTKDWRIRLSTYQRPPATVSSRKKHGTMVGGGTAQYKRIMLVEEIMKRCNGLFPGDSEMVPAFQKLQKEQNKNSATSDRDTVMRAVKVLVDSNKLIRTSFYFTDRFGRPQTKWIIRNPEVSPDTEEFKELQRRIELMFPKNYVPPPFGDGIIGKPDQRKNIDRFQYQPGKSIVQPSGNAWVIDVDAKRRELENKRLAAEKMRKKDEMKRLKAQAERSKKKLAAQAKARRSFKAVPWRNARPIFMHIDEDDPDHVLPSIETGDAANGGPVKSGRIRYRGIRPVPAMDASELEDLGEGYWVPIDDPYGLPRRAWRNEIILFRPPPEYREQDALTLLNPVQRFHAKTGTFATDFVVRPHGEDTGPKEPTTFEFKNYSTTDPNDVELYEATNEAENRFHPDKLPPGRRRRCRAVSSDSWDYDDDDTDYDEIEDLAWYENKELMLMRDQHPGLHIGETDGGFMHFSIGHDQDVAQRWLEYGINPMDQIIMHGAELGDYQGMTFTDRNFKPSLPGLFPRGMRMMRMPRKKRLGTNQVQSGQCHISITESRRLFFACIALRVLAGELENIIQWRTIVDIFENHPNFDLATFKARWMRMHHNYKDTVDRIQREFQDAFLKAYKKGVLPKLEITNGSRLDYTDVKDWHKVIDWAVETLPIFPDEIELPPTREELHYRFEFKTHPVDLQETRERHEHQHATNSRRETIAHEMNFSLPIRSKTSDPDDKAVTDLALAKSYIRANCTVEDDRYDSVAAGEVLRNAVPSALGKAMKQLHEAKILAHNFKLKTKADVRNFHLSVSYREIFDKRLLDATHFEEAIAFKRLLDKTFTEKKDDPRLLLDYTVSEGGILALTEMVAAGHLKLKPVLPPVNNTIGDPFPRMTVWGFNEGQYKLRSMDKKMFLWDVEISPTEAYQTGFPTEQNLKDIEPPRRCKTDPEGLEKIPLWYDILGNLLSRYWDPIVKSVVQHLAIRSGSTIATLATPYRGLIWDWEIELLVDWLVEIGVAEVKPGGSVQAKAWWWTVVPGSLEGDKASAFASVDHGNGMTYEDGEQEEHGAGVQQFLNAVAKVHLPKRRRLRKDLGVAVGDGGEDEAEEEYVAIGEDAGAGAIATDAVEGPADGDGEPVGAGAVEEGASTVGGASIEEVAAADDGDVEMTED